MRLDKDQTADADKIAVHMRTFPKNHILDSNRILNDVSIEKDYGDDLISFLIDIGIVKSHGKGSRNSRAISLTQNGRLKYMSGSLGADLAVASNQEAQKIKDRNNNNNVFNINGQTISNFGNNITENTTSNNNEIPSLSEISRKSWIVRNKEILVAILAVLAGVFAIIKLFIA